MVLSLSLCRSPPPHPPPSFSWCNSVHRPLDLQIGVQGRFSHSNGTARRLTPTRSLHTFSPSINLFLTCIHFHMLQSYHAAVSHKLMCALTHSLVHALTRSHMDTLPLVHVLTHSHRSTLSCVRLSGVWLRGPVDNFFSFFFSLLRQRNKKNITCLHVRVLSAPPHTHTERTASSNRIDGSPTECASAEQHDGECSCLRWS
jgi:hypothetical protein